MRDTFDELGPVACEGRWCTVVEEQCCLSGVPLYTVHLRAPDGSVSVDVAHAVGEPPAFLLDRSGRFAWDHWGLPRWSADVEPGPSPLQEATDAHREAAADAARCDGVERWSVSDIACAELGCVAVVAAAADAPVPFRVTWQPAGQPGATALWAIRQHPGYGGPGVDLTADTVGWSASDCKPGCPLGDFARVSAGTLVRPPEPGDVPRVADPAGLPRDVPIPALRAERLADVVFGPFDWAGPSDAALRVTLALADQVVVVDAVVIDDTFDVGADRGVDRDHLEIVREDGPLAGAMIAAIPAPDGTVALMPWRGPGGTEVRSPVPFGRCASSVSGPERTFHCEIDRTRLWPSEGPATVAIRYSDADHQRQEAIIEARGTLTPRAPFVRPLEPTGCR